MKAKKKKNSEEDIDRYFCELEDRLIDLLDIYFMQIENDDLDPYSQESYEKLLGLIIEFHLSNSGETASYLIENNLK